MPNLEAIACANQIAANIDVVAETTGLVVDQIGADAAVFSRQAGKADTTIKQDLSRANGLLLGYSAGHGGAIAHASEIVPVLEGLSGQWNSARDGSKIEWLKVYLRSTFQLWPAAISNVALAHTVFRLIGEIGENINCGVSNAADDMEGTIVSALEIVRTELADETQPALAKLSQIGGEDNCTDELDILLQGMISCNDDARNGISENVAKVRKDLASLQAVAGKEDSVMTLGVQSLDAAKKQLIDALQGAKHIRNVAGNGVKNERTGIDIDTTVRGCLANQRSAIKALNTTAECAPFALQRFMGMRSGLRQAGESCANSNATLEHMLGQMATFQNTLFSHIGHLQQQSG